VRVVINRPEDDPILAFVIALGLGFVFLLLTDWPLANIHQRFVPWWPAILASLVALWGITPPVRRLGAAIGWAFYQLTQK
jgi:hypothetical protein